MGAIDSDTSRVERLLAVSGSMVKFKSFPKPTKQIKKKKHIRRERKTPISKLKEQLLGLVKEIVRKRDDYTCQKCGKKVEGSNCHVSHVIPVSAGNRLAFDPLNMKILCYHDHINWWHKNPIESSAWFEKKFPDRYLYLHYHKHERVHWKESDYLEMINKIVLDKAEGLW